LQEKFGAVFLAHPVYSLYVPLSFNRILNFYKIRKFLVTACQLVTVLFHQMLVSPDKIYTIITFDKEVMWYPFPDVYLSICKLFVSKISQSYQRIWLTFSGKVRLNPA